MSPGVSTLLPTPDRALAVGAHPDDVEFGCGATLARWSAQGAECHLLVLTDGSKGTWDVDADLPALVARRQEEQHSALRALGCRGDAHFLGRVDGELEADRATRREVAAVIRTVKPDVVLGHDPWRRYRLHPDHRHAGLLTVEGLVAARDPHFFPDLGLDHHRPEALLLFEADEPNHVEPADIDHADAKVAALLAHRSQWRSTMQVADEHDEAGLAAFRARVDDTLAEDGAIAGIGAGEAFRLIDDV